MPEENPQRMSSVNPACPVCDAVTVTCATPYSYSYPVCSFRLLILRSFRRLLPDEMQASACLLRTLSFADTEYNKDSHQQRRHQVTGEPCPTAANAIPSMGDPASQVGRTSAEDGALLLAAYSVSPVPAVTSRQRCHYSCGVLRATAVRSGPGAQRSTLAAPTCLPPLPPLAAYGGALRALSLRCVHFIQPLLIHPFVHPGEERSRMQEYPP